MNTNWENLISNINQTELFTTIITIGVIIIVAYFAKRGIHRTSDKLIERLVVSNSAIQEHRREETLQHVMRGVITVLVYLVAALMSLEELGIEVGPILAAAGIVGVAVGFGGQYLVRDLITGLFIILENQYRVGDVVCIDGTCGQVEDVNLRLTTLRDLDGTVHHIPNGEVSIASNLTKVKSGINLDVGVGYEDDLENVIAVVNQVGIDLAGDDDFGKSITAAPKFERVEAFGDSAVVIKILGSTTPGAQWRVTGELRKRLKIAFDNNGISLPYPHQVMVNKS